MMTTRKRTTVLEISLEQDNASQTQRNHVRKSVGVDLSYFDLMRLQMHIFVIRFSSLFQHLSFESVYSFDLTFLSKTFSLFGVSFYCL